MKAGGRTLLHHPRPDWTHYQRARRAPRPMGIFDMAFVNCPKCGNSIHDIMPNCPMCRTPKAERESSRPNQSARPEASPSHETSSQAPADKSIEPNSAIGCFLGGLSKYFSFSGRASRREFWSFYFFYLLLLVILLFSSLIAKSNGAERLADRLFIAFLSYPYAFAIPSLAVGVRRMHDSDRSGWWVLFPIINLILWLLDSTPGTNRFGPNRKGV